MPGNGQCIGKASATWDTYLTSKRLAHEHAGTFGDLGLRMSAYLPIKEPRLVDDVDGSQSASNLGCFSIYKVSKCSWQKPRTSIASSLFGLPWTRSISRLMCGSTWSARTTTKPVKSEVGARRSEFFPSTRCRFWGGSPEGPGSLYEVVSVELMGDSTVVVHQRVQGFGRRAGYVKPLGSKK